MKPEVSIIIPVYNAQNTIAMTIDSILKQSFSNWELILVNDGSSDKTLEICRKYDDERIVIIDKENGGVVAAYKKGIETASGDFITFCDSDDTYASDFLETAVCDIKNYDCDFVSYAYNARNFLNNIDNIKTNGLKNGLYETKNIKDNFIFNNSVKGCYYTLLVFRWNKIYSAAVLKSILPDLDDGCRQMEDNIFTSLVVLNSKSFFVSDRYFYNYRIDNDSISKGYNENILSQYEYSFKHLTELLSKFGYTDDKNQLVYMRFDFFRIIYRRMAKNRSFSQCKQFLNNNDLIKMLKTIRLSKITVMKNKIFYILLKLNLKFTLYCLFKKL